MDDVMFAHNRRDSRRRKKAHTQSESVWGSADLTSVDLVTIL